MPRSSPSQAPTPAASRWRSSDLLTTLSGERVAVRILCREPRRLVLPQLGEVGSLDQLLGGLAKREQIGAVVVGASHHRPAPERRRVAYRSGPETGWQRYPMPLGRLQHW